MVVIGALILNGTAAFGQQGSDTEASGGLMNGPGRTHPGSSELLTADAAELAAGNTQFALDLYQHLRHQNGNLLYSPYSISQALAMTYAGARTRTEQQMANTLHFTLDQKALHPAFKSLALEFRSPGESGLWPEGRGFRLNIANALWGQQGLGFLPGFLDVLEDNYGAGMRLVDFQRNSEGARVTINDWVSDCTEGRIKDLLASGTINSNTRLVLTNAIYFKASWQRQFKEEATHDDDFHLLGGTKIRVPMMSQTAHFGYANSKDVQAVELRYDGGTLSMVILLPQAGRFRKVEESLEAERVASILANLSRTKVILTMPKFEYESSFSLNQTLIKMGMRDAFDPRQADFSAMTGKRDLKIDHAVHKAFILVDERGTEAAAATAVAMGTISIQKPKPPIVVKIDRPFVYLIRDMKTTTLLFVGRVLNPST
jgi:serpin B